MKSSCPTSSSMACRAPRPAQRAWPRQLARARRGDGRDRDAQDGRLGVADLKEEALAAPVVEHGVETYTHTARVTPPRARPARTRPARGRARGRPFSSTVRVLQSPPPRPPPPPPRPRCPRPSPPLQL